MLFHIFGLLIDIIVQLPFFIYYSVRDLFTKNGRFPLYGVRFYVGKQGSGKTMSMTNELERIRARYPKCKIYTNYGYKAQDGEIKDIADLLDRDNYNGSDGVVFAIDEIQNEWSCGNSRSFPETILSVITQQRKNAVCILCTSQVFSRVAKPLREQAFYVTECRTINGRLTLNFEYDGFEYAECIDHSENYKCEHRFLRNCGCFLQSNRLRRSYDTFAVIEKLTNKEVFS